MKEKLWGFFWNFQVVRAGRRRDLRRVISSGSVAVCDRAQVTNRQVQQDGEDITQIRDCCFPFEGEQPLSHQLSKGDSGQLMFFARSYYQTRPNLLDIENLKRLTILIFIFTGMC